jgi:hypothetical protein
MSLTTYSIFYYGHIVTSENKYIDFKEGATTYAASLPVGSYTLTRYCELIAEAMNDVGSYTYTCSVNRTTRIITISGSSAFDFLGSTGVNASQNICSLAGITAADSLATTSVVGASASGSYFEPQFTLQDHVATQNNKRALNAVVTKSASGNKVSVQSFGEERFLECSLKYITEIRQPTGQKLKTDTSALTNVRAFLDHCVEKRPIEYMANINDRDTYEKLILESTDIESDGSGYRLKELYDKGLPGYYDSGILKFKVITE